MSAVYASPLILSCMGGWCTQRDHCPHYHAGRAGTRPSERLCIPGNDGKSDIARIRITVRRPPETDPPVQFDASQIGACA